MMEKIVRFSNNNHEPWENDYEYETLQYVFSFRCFPWEIYSSYYILGTYVRGESNDSESNDSESNDSESNDDNTIQSPKNTIYDIDKCLDEAYLEKDYKLIFLFHLLIENWPDSKKYLHIAER